MKMTYWKLGCIIAKQAPLCHKTSQYVLKFECGINIFKMLHKCNISNLEIRYKKWYCIYAIATYQKGEDMTQVNPGLLGLTCKRIHCTHSLGFTRAWCCSIHSPQADKRKYRRAAINMIVIINLLSSFMAIHAWWLPIFVVLDVASIRGT